MHFTYFLLNCKRLIFIYYLYFLAGESWAPLQSWSLMSPDCREGRISLGEGLLPFISNNTVILSSIGNTRVGCFCFLMKNVVIISVQVVFSLLVTILQILSPALCQPQDCSNLSRNIKIIFLKHTTTWKQANIIGDVDMYRWRKMLKVYLEWAGEPGEPSHSLWSAGGVFWFNVTPASSCQLLPPISSYVTHQAGPDYSSSVQVKRYTWIVKQEFQLQVLSVLCSHYINYQLLTF